MLFFQQSVFAVWLFNIYLSIYLLFQVYCLLFYISCFLFKFKCIVFSPFFTTISCFFFNFLFALPHTFLFVFFSFVKSEMRYSFVSLALESFSRGWIQQQSVLVWKLISTTQLRVRPRHRLTFESLDREDRLLLVSLAGKLLSASSGDVCVPIFFLPHPE